MVTVGIRCKEELCIEIKSIIEEIYNIAPVKSTGIDEGRGVLDRQLSPDSYPIERPTVTIMNGKKVYTYFQKLNLI